jgi:hypothetical protein
MVLFVRFVSLGPSAGAGSSGDLPGFEVTHIRDSGPHIGRPARFIVLSGAALAMVALVLGLGELSLRVLAPGHDVSAVEYEALRGWHGRPSAHLVFDQPSFSIDVAHNSMGYRDRERTRSKPDGAFRVLCCGDSFTWGWGVEQDQIYTRVLEDMCRRVDGRAEVINMGVNGQNTAQALLGLVDHGFDYSPDLVIYQASDNDITGNVPLGRTGIWVSPYYTLNDNGELALQGSPVPKPAFWSELKYRAALHSRLAYFLRHRIDVLATRVSAARRAPSVDDTTARAASDAPFQLFCAIVNGMNDECGGRGVRFAVLIDFPMSGERLDYWKTHCSDVETLSVHRYLLSREQATGRPAFIERDGHWTADGHLWIAQYLFSNLARPMLMERRTSG